MTHPGRLLRMTVLAVLLVGVLLPIVAWLGMTLRASFGVLPAVGAITLSLGSLTRLRSNPFWALVDEDLSALAAQDLARDKAAALPR